MFSRWEDDPRYDYYLAQDLMKEREQEIKKKLSNIIARQYVDFFYDLLALSKRLNHLEEEDIKLLNLSKVDLAVFDDDEIDFLHQYKREKEDECID